MYYRSWVLFILLEYRIVIIIDFHNVQCFIENSITPARYFHLACQLFKYKYSVIESLYTYRNSMYLQRANVNFAMMIKKV